MIRVSDYNIYVPLKNEKNEYLMLHGYSGALSVVSEDIYLNISQSKNCSDLLEKLTDKEKNELMENGYLTEKSSEEEIELFKKVASVLLKKCKVSDYYLTLIPTYNCNFRCTYCFEKGNYKNGNSNLKLKMDRQMVDNIFNNLEELKSEGKKVMSTVYLFGGEPLMRENLDLIKYIVDIGCNKGYKFSAITNGYDLQLYEDLLAEDKIFSLQITLDGDEELHNKRRFLHNGGKTFTQIVSNIDRCLHKGIRVSLRTNIDKTNIDEIEKLIDLYNEYGWTDNKLFSYYFKSLHACYEEDENKRMFDDEVMKKISSIPNISNKFILNSFYSAINSFFQSVLNDGRIALHKPIYCSASSSMIVIDPLGEIYPCWEVTADPNNNIGKLVNGKISFNSNAKYWRERNVMNMDSCVKCPYALICSGNCPSHAKAYSGDIYSAHCEKFINIFNEVLPELYRNYVNINKAKSNK